MRADMPKLATLAIACAALMLAAVAVTASAQKPKAPSKPTSDPTLSAITRPAENAEIAALPADPAKTLVTERCLVCHSAGLITQQHKDAAAWGRTVTQMRGWGSPIQDDDQTAIVAYLSKHFGPRQP